MSYTVILKRRAAKELAQLDPKVRAVIVGFIKTNLEGCENPRTAKGAKKLEGVDDGWRWRIGTYRILGTVDDETVTIELFKIGHRRDVYDRL